MALQHCSFGFFSPPVYFYLQTGPTTIFSIRFTFGHYVFICNLQFFFVFRFQSFKSSLHMYCFLCHDMVDHWCLSQIILICISVCVTLLSTYFIDKTNFAKTNHFHQIQIAIPSVAFSFLQAFYHLPLDLNAGLL